MSEIRSWDRWGERSVAGTPITDSLTVTQIGNRDIPVRIVAWPEGAPKQEDVPQAGEKRKWLTEKEVEIITGIPFLYEGEWAVLVSGCNKAVGTPIAMLKYLEEIPPTPPQTYTESEIRAAITDAEETYSTHKSSASLGEFLIIELQMRKRHSLK